MALRKVRMVPPPWIVGLCKRVIFLLLVSHGHLLSFNGLLVSIVGVASERVVYGLAMETCLEEL